MAGKRKFRKFGRKSRKSWKRGHKTTSFSKKVKRIMSKGKEEHYGELTFNNAGVVAWGAASLAAGQL